MITSIDSKTVGRLDAVPAKQGSKTGRTFLLIMFITLLVDAIPGLGIGIAPGLSAKNLYLYTLCILIAARAVMNPHGLRFTDLHVHIPFLLAITYAFLTLSISSVFDPTYDTVHGIKSLKNKMIDLFLLMLVFRYVVSSKADFIWLINAVLVLLFVSNFLTLIDFLNIPDLGIVGTHKGRIEGPIGAANQYGTLLAFMLPIAIGTLSQKRGLTLWFWRFGIFVSLVLLIGTGSRGSYVGLIGGSIAAVFYLRNYLDVRVAARMAGIALLVLTVTLVGFFVVNPEFLLNILDKSATGSIETASSGRWAIWGAALGVMLEAPYSFIVGYGWNTFDTSGIWKSAHSEYVNRFFESGIIGLSIFLYLIWSIIQRSRYSLRNADSEGRRLIISFIVAMFILAVDIIFVMPYTAWSIIWILIGLMLGVQSVFVYSEPGSRPEGKVRDLPAKRVHRMEPSSQR